MPAQTRIIHYYVCLGAAGGKEWKVNMNAIILSLISWFVFLINPPIGLGSLVILIETGLYGLMEYRIKKADDSEKDN